VYSKLLLYSLLRPLPLHDSLLQVATSSTLCKSQLVSEKKLHSLASQAARMIISTHFGGHIYSIERHQQLMLAVGNPGNIKQQLIANKLLLDVEATTISTRRACLAALYNTAITIDVLVFTVNTMHSSRNVHTVTHGLCPPSDSL
jgi:hypothetical protein